nr:lipoyl synthase [Candidatus Syntrophocurvum alkaliphilum]
MNKKIPETKSLNSMNKMLKELSLNTVCEGAKCPNKGECFKDKTATFMLMGDTCTRNCSFCGVNKGNPNKIDPEEPINVAKGVKHLGLTHAVITSVTRDDLDDGGAEHFVETINNIKKFNPNTSIEVLIPDFKGNKEAILKIIKAKPEIINHNIETVPALYNLIRPQASYEKSLKLLQFVKEENPLILTKTGIMIGLGESKQNVLDLINDLVNINCDILTIGQYLQPSRNHLEVKEYITLEQFSEYKDIAKQKGIRFVESGPFVRSSYKAATALNYLKKG